MRLCNGPAKQGQSPEVAPEVTVSLMSQYSPAHRAAGMPLLSRYISMAEYKKVVGLLSHLGMENGWVQQMGAQEDYVPDFEREGSPFLLPPR